MNNDVGVLGTLDRLGKKIETGILDPLCVRWDRVGDWSHKKLGAIKMEWAVQPKYSGIWELLSLLRAEGFRDVMVGHHREKKESTSTISGRLEGIIFVMHLYTEEGYAKHILKEGPLPVGPLFEQGTL